MRPVRQAPAQPPGAAGSRGVYHPKCSRNAPLIRATGGSKQGRPSYGCHISKWNDDHTPICPRGDAFCAFAGASGESLCFLLASVALTLPTSHLGLSDLNQNRKNKMKPFLKMAAAPASAMLALAFVAMTTPASTAAPTSRPICKAAT